LDTKRGRTLLERSPGKQPRALLVEVDPQAAREVIVHDDQALTAPECIERGQDAGLPLGASPELPDV
jgi:hypothetical protein